MNAIPVATIITRHSADCPYKEDPSYKRCACWKAIRYFAKEPGDSQAKQHFQTTKQRTWAGAERFKRDWEAARDPVRRAETPEAISVGDAIAVFLQEKDGQNLSDTVRGKYKREMERLRQFLDTQVSAPGPVFLLQDVTLPHLTAYRATWPEAYPASLTRSKVQERLKGFFKYASLAYNLRRNPAQGLTSIRIDSTATLPFEPEEYEAILQTIPLAFPDDLWRIRMLALTQLMRWSGLAIRDAVCLERSQIQKGADGITRIVTYRKKTRRNANQICVRVPIPPFVAEALTTVVNGNPRYVFWTGESLGDTVAKNYQEAFRKLFKQAKIEDGHPHRLRDTAAVEWLKKGISLFEVSRLLGHTSVKTTEKHYAPWVQGLQDKVDQAVVATW